jgi:hypothetical protein
MKDINIFEDDLMLELERLGYLIDEKQIVLNNQRELLKRDDSIQSEYIKLFKETNSLMQLHHLLFIQLAQLTQNEELLRGVKESKEILMRD